MGWRAENPKIELVRSQPVRQSLLMAQLAPDLSRDRSENARSRVRRRFYVLCRAAFDDRVIVQLLQRGTYWGPRSPGDAQQAKDRVQQHFLMVEADNGEDAIVLAQTVLTEAGGGVPDLTLVGPAADA